MSDPKLSQFDKQSYLNLETFRKSGAGVQTPVWFAEQNGVFYVRTGEVSGKVKRIRNNGRVRVAPCDARGGLKGEWVEAKAGLVKEDARLEAANRLLNQKYGLMKRLFDGINALQKAKWATVEIELE
jgi:uncharacterized protein